MNRNKRDHAVRVFMSKDKARVMLMSLKRGGKPLNWCMPLPPLIGARNRCRPQPYSSEQRHLARSWLVKSH